MKRHAISLFALAGVLAMATAVAGWWAVPVASFAWTLARPRRGAVLLAVAAAILSWGVLLAWTAQSGPLGAVADVVGRIVSLPGRSSLALALAYAGLLAGAAALLAQAIRPPRAGTAR